MIKTTIKNGAGIRAKEHKGAVEAIREARTALEHSIASKQAIEIRLIYTPNLKRSSNRAIKGIVVVAKRE